MQTLLCTRIISVGMMMTVSSIFETTVVPLAHGPPCLSEFFALQKIPYSQKVMLLLACFLVLVPECLCYYDHQIDYPSKVAFTGKNASKQGMIDTFLFSLLLVVLRVLQAIAYYILLIRIFILKLYIELVGSGNVLFFINYVSNLIVPTHALFLLLTCMEYILSLFQTCISILISISISLFSSKTGISNH